MIVACGDSGALHRHSGDLTERRSLELEEDEIISYLLSWRPADLIRGFKTDLAMDRTRTNAKLALTRANKLLFVISPSISRRSPF